MTGRLSFDHLDAVDVAFDGAGTAADRFLAALAGRGDGELSQREAQVAAYVAQELTNRQIAAAEHISERTVDTHIRHIFTKLGFATRAQLAAWQATVSERVRTPDQ